jgi:hypothetical protein
MISVKRARSFDTPRNNGINSLHLGSAVKYGSRILFFHRIVNRIGAVSTVVKYKLCMASYEENLGTILVVLVQTLRIATDQ